MKVSIVIPVFNAGKYLNECIESALNQTYPDTEIIAVNDGSTDESLEILNQYSDRISVIDKENGGTASALNAGIKRMNGEWFKWISADDILYEEAIDKLLRAASKENGKIIYSDYDVIDKNSNFLYTFKEPIYKNYDLFAAKLWIRFIGNASSILIHRSCFDVVGLFNENLRFGEDYEWWLRACLVHDYRFTHLREPVVKYRIHPKQTTEKVKMFTAENDSKIKETIKQIIIDDNPEKWEKLVMDRKKYNKESIKNRIKRLIKLCLKYVPPQIKNRILELNKNEDRNYS